VGLPGKRTNLGCQVSSVTGVGFGDTHPKKTLKASVSEKSPVSVPGVETDMTLFYHPDKDRSSPVRRFPKIR
jgi:hypothetical protein